MFGSYELALKGMGEQTYHFDYIKRLADEDLASYIAFVRSDDKDRTRTSVFSKMNLCNTPDCPPGQVLNGFVTHGRRKE